MKAREDKYKDLAENAKKFAASLNDAMGAFKSQVEELKGNMNEEEKQLYEKQFSSFNEFHDKFAKKNIELQDVLHKFNVKIKKY